MQVRLRKKEFTSFDVVAAVEELKQSIIDSRVNNIYQFDEKTLGFKLHKIDMPPIRLIMEAGRRMHLTQYAEESPLTPPAFCMALRKYLRGAWLIGIEQYEFERIVIVRFKTKTGPLNLILEIFGQGNFILTNEKDVIIQALYFKHMRDRNIVRNEVLVFPPPISKNPNKATLEELAKAIGEAKETEVVRATARFFGVGGIYAEEILLRANVEKIKPCNTLTSSEVKAIFDSLQDLLGNVSNLRLEPCIVLGVDNDFLDVVPFKLKQYEKFNVQTYDKFNQALDEFYVRVTAAEKAAASVEVDKLKQEANRLKRVIADQEKSILEEEQKTEKDKTIGNTIYAHINELQTFFDKLLKANLAGKDWNTLIHAIFEAKKAGIVPAVYVESFDGRNLALNLSLDGLHFSVNLRKSLYDNAAEYYELGKKAKLKTAGAITALEDSKRKLAKIEQELQEAEKLRNLKPAEIMEALAKRKVESKEWYQKFRWFTSSEGFLVVAGKDVVSNEVLIKKHAGQEDVVFHAEITGAPFVVIKSEGKTITEQVLHEAGEYAAALCRAWREGAGSVDVYWVKPDQLSKSAPSGESIPHGAFFVVGKRNWSRSVPLRLAVGAVVNEEDVHFVGGPIDAVKAKTKFYIVIVPGDLSGKAILTQVLRAIMFKLSKEQREILGKTSIEQIREFVPYTKATITEKVA